MYGMWFPPILFKGPYTPALLLIEGMSKEGLEDSSFKGVQVFTNKYKCSSYCSPNGDETGQFICR